MSALASAPAAPDLHGPTPQPHQMLANEGRVPALPCAAALALGALCAAALRGSAPSVLRSACGLSAALTGLALCAPAAVNLLDTRKRRPHARWFTDAALLTALIVAGGLTYTARNVLVARDDVSLRGGDPPGRETVVSGRAVEVRSSDGGAASVVLRVSNAGDRPAHGEATLAPASGLLWARCSGTGPVPSAGDSLVLRGVLAEPPGRRNPGAFDFAEYLRNRGVRATLNGARVVSSRRGAGPRPSAWVSRTVAGHLPGIEGEVLTGLLLGRSHALPEDLTEAFRRSGTVHVLAVSGLHVGFVLLMVHAVLRSLRLPPRAARALVLPALALFVAVVGVRPSVARASVMAGALVTGSLLERRTNALNSLGVAALVLLAARPGSVFDLGFRLSFTAVCGILLLHGPVSRLLERHLRPLGRAASRIGDLVALSVSAQVGVSSVLVAAFGQLSVVAPVANLVAVPAAGGAVAGAFAMLATSPMGPWPAGAFAAFTWLCVRALTLVSELAASMSFAAVRVPCSTWPVFLLASAGLAVAARAPGRIRARAGVSLFAASAVAASLVLLVGPGRSSTRVVFFDVGQGDSVLFELPRGHRVLIDSGPGPVGPPVSDAGRLDDGFEAGRLDAGPFGGGFDAGSGVIVPHLRRTCSRRLDAVVVTHAHADHLGGVAAVMRACDVERLLVPPGAATDTRYAHVVGPAREGGTEVIEVAAGDTVRAGDLLLRVLAPARSAAANCDSENDRSLVVAAELAGCTVLATGDAEVRAETALVRSGADLGADVLKVGHHGSATSSSEDFLRAVGPRIAVICVGAGNRHGHPHAGTVGRLVSAGASVFRTDEDGAVLVTLGRGAVRAEGMKGRKGPVDETGRTHREPPSVDRLSDRARRGSRAGRIRDRGASRLPERPAPR